MGEGCSRARELFCTWGGCGKSSAAEGDLGRCRSPGGFSVCSGFPTFLPCLAGREQDRLLC